MRGRAVLGGATCAAVLILAAVGLTACGGVTRPWLLATPITYATQPPVLSQPTSIPVSLDPTSVVRVLEPSSVGRPLDLRQTYVRPRVRPQGSVFDNLMPTGYWTTPYWSGVDTRTIELERGQGNGTWHVPAPAELSQSVPIYLSERKMLSDALGGRAASVRYVWAGHDLAWWVVRFADGTEGAIPISHYVSVYVDGTLLDYGHLYPAAIIYGEARKA